MIGHCVNGPARRQWLADIDRPMRPALRRFRRRALISAKVIAALFIIAMLTVIMLLMLANAVQQPLTTTPTAKPVSAPAAHVVRRWT